jgi:hypothetical protein
VTAALLRVLPSRLPKKSAKGGRQHAAISFRRDGSRVADDVLSLPRSG